MEERREFIRLTAHHLLKYKIIDKEKALSFVRNISAGGVLFFAKEAIPEGTIVELEINFPSFPREIKATARVVRAIKQQKVEGFDIAAEFMSIDEEAKGFMDIKILEVQKEVDKD